MKLFNIPGWFIHAAEINALIQLKKTMPHMFYPDREIYSSYDFPSTFLWNGGRVRFGESYDPYYLDTLMQHYNKTDLILCHTCTNCLINEQLTQDWMCNLFFQKYYRPQDYVIIVSDILREHLLHYCDPSKFIYSTTLNITNIDKVNEITKTNIYVLNYDYNNNNEYLKQLMHPENVEVLCAELCGPHCEHRQQHYRELSELQLGLIDSNSKIIKGNCIHHEPQSPIERVKHSPNAVTNERVDELEKMGFRYFKISGRTLDTRDWFQIMAYYLILPQYQTTAIPMLTGMMNMQNKIKKI